jgi:hypothetical protein
LRRLIIMMPPRHMKSLSVNVAFPPWVWAQRKRSPLTGPGVGFLSTSYAQHLSVRDNVKSRRVIDSLWYQRGWGDRFSLTSDQNTKIRFENDHGGYRIASSVDGTATGDGGDIIIIDDPISAKEALSPTVLAGANEWLDGTMSTRLNDPKTGAYIIVMQRLNERDPVGHVLEQAKQDGGEEWTVLCLPARYEPDHPFVYAKDPRKEPRRASVARAHGRKQSQVARGLAGPIRHGRAAAAAAGAEVGRHVRPERFRDRGAAPADLEECGAWDFAASVPAPGPSRTGPCGSRWAGSARPGFSTSSTSSAFRARPQPSRPSSGTPPARTAASAASASRRIPGQAGKAQAAAYIRMLAGYNVKAIRPTGSKEARATPVSAQAEAGNVKLVKADWNEPFLQEIELFPFGKHDDQVDAFSDAFNDLAAGQQGQRVARDPRYASREQAGRRTPQVARQICGLHPQHRPGAAADRDVRQRLGAGRADDPPAARRDEPRERTGRRDRADRNAGDGE